MWCLDHCSHVRVQVFDHFNSICGESQVVTYLQKPVMVDGVKRFGKIRLEEVDILAAESGIFQQHCEQFQLLLCASVCSEAALLIAEDVVLFCKVGHGLIDHAGPDFV